MHTYVKCMTKSYDLHVRSRKSLSQNQHHHLPSHSHTHHTLCFQSHIEKMDLLMLTSSPQPPHAVFSSIGIVCPKIFVLTACKLVPPRPSQRDSFLQLSYRRRTLIQCTQRSIDGEHKQRQHEAPQHHQVSPVFVLPSLLGKLVCPETKFRPLRPTLSAR